MEDKNPWIKYNYWDNEIETDAKREKKLGQCYKRKIN